jgi:DNA polymerase (family 10)
MQDRFAVAAGLRKIARLLEIKGENPFKAQAYERGAAALENLDGDFAALIKAGRLQEIAGVGRALAAIIEEIHRTGECYLLQQLREGLPAGAVELSDLPGLNLKKIIALDEAGIKSIVDLATACAEGRVSQVKGFGAKSQAKLLAEIAKRERPKDAALPLDKALEEAEQILSYLRGAAELSEAALAGALRRRRETVRCIVIVAASKKPGAVLDRFLGFPALAHTEELDENRCRARLASGVKTELVVVEPQDYAGAVLTETGSRRHVAKLREIARAQGSDLFPNHDRMRIGSEEDVYRHLGLPLIPAEMREGEGEIEAALAGRLPQLLTVDDILGMTHCHTLYSDGRNGIEEMARAAEAMGMSYLTITDHSPTAYYARGVGLDRLRAQWDEIDQVQERVKIKILKGTESDILADGSLDYPDAFLECFDVIIASIHARHKMDTEQMTARLLRAVKLPFFNIWGHPLGRLIPSRPPFDCRMEQILDAIAASRCAIEVNGDPRRLDLEPRWIRAARDRGIRFVISTDAHSTGALKNLSYGVAMARRGWLGRSDVLNALDTEAFSLAVRP